MASTLTFAILRFLRFRLGLPILAAGESSKDPQGQFGIKHLFIWTTIVALLFGIGGAVDWESVLEDVLKRDLVVNLGRTLLVTLSLVAVVWAVMGETKLIVARIGILLVFLLVIAAGLYFLDLNSVKNNDSTLAIGWVWINRITEQQKFDIARVWVIWTILHGLFLASLLLVFRFAGFRFFKAAKNQVK